VRARAGGVALALAAAAATVACSNDHPPPPARGAGDAARGPRASEVDEAKSIETTTPYRATIAHGTELYLPPWFSPKNGGYDLIVHFHGMSKLQEANVEHAHLNVAVVSVNLGAGTDAYGRAFRDASAFERLLDETRAEIEKSGRAHGAEPRRIALSAWSAGALSVAKILGESSYADRVDAVLLADGLFTSYSDPKKHVINVGPLERFVRLVEVATKDDKLFAITHTSIPTYDYPSMIEVVGKLLELTGSDKVPSTAVGPHEMHETYDVDRGSFHVKGYEGVTAKDHIKQIRAMGETLYPYLKARWDAQDAAAAADKAHGRAHGQPSAAR
jgi:hypothetical protein